MRDARTCTHVKNCSKARVRGATEHSPPAHKRKKAIHRLLRWGGAPKEDNAESPSKLGGTGYTPEERSSLAAYTYLLVRNYARSRVRVFIHVHALCLPMNVYTENTNKIMTKNRSDNEQAPH